jgi:hypothetical protein
MSGCGAVGIHLRLRMRRWQDLESRRITNISLRRVIFGIDQKFRYVGEGTANELLMNKRFPDNSVPMARFNGFRISRIRQRLTTKSCVSGRMTKTVGAIMV